MGHRSRTDVLDRDTIGRYLARLGMSDPGEPSVAALHALHRAHVERVPYEVVDVTLERPTTADPRDSVDRILRGRGGYCVQLNGGFSTLLAALGFRVTWHRALVQAGAAPPEPGVASAPHLAPTVDIDGETWLADVGLGDGLHDPLPLRPGRYPQGPFTFRLGPSQVEPGGWRFDHDPRGSIAGMDVSMAGAVRSDFDAWHPFLVTSPTSRLVRTLSVMRRDAVGVDVLTGCVLARIDGGGRAVRELDDPSDWFAALADVFGLDLRDLDREERDRLWTRVRGAHERWQAARAARQAAA